MKFFAWGDDLTTDMALIDRQHQEYVRRTNAFLEASVDGDAKDAQKVRHTFEFLRRYIEEHFTTEEELMGEYNFPARQRHVVQHRHFAEQVGTIGQSLDFGPLSTDQMLRLNYLLVDWFQRHIRHLDRELTSFLAVEAKKSGNSKLKNLFRGLFE